MGLFSNEIDRSSLKAGDHIYCYRNFHIYSHHGIYVGKNRVIHFTRTREPESSKSSHRMITICQECKYAPREDRGVVKCCLECFLKGHRLFRFKYGVSSSRFILNSTGACTTGSCLYSPDQVVRRATKRLKKGFGEYDLLGNNCETFAVYCKTNKRMSLQAYSWKNRAKTFYHDLTSQPFSVKNTAKTMLKLGVTYKFDTLRRDREVHQQDYDDHHHHHQEEEKDDDDEEEEDDDDDDDHPR